jgi:protein-S-isoprenylcysteine O-methyltransferase Ste14
MEYLFLAAAWAAYALLHSLLASLVVKDWVSRRWPALAPGYRLAYNLVALLALLPLIWAIHAHPGPWLWRWTGWAAWLANGLALAALLALASSSAPYDMKEFLGLKAWRERRRDAAEHDGLVISRWHRHVRHPWYALALVLVWTRDMNAAMLVSALAITAYFVIGSRLEERKLAAHFGDAYREYCRRVPGLLPLPGKRLSAAEAEALVQRSRHR